jgi:hypothetical protein
MTLVLRGILRFHIKNLTFTFCSFKMGMSRGGQATKATSFKGLAKAPTHKRNGEDSP